LASQHVAGGGYDQIETPNAGPGQGWISTAKHACAYVAPVGVGAAAEAKGLFPYDPYNQPHGVLDFYRQAARATKQQALWVRLIPSPPVGC
jgi:hypothetical protein